MLIGCLKKQRQKLKLKNKSADIRKTSVLSLMQLNVNEAIKPLKDLLKIEEDKNIRTTLKMGLTSRLR